MKQKILYVEDEPHLGKIVTDLLDRQGFEVLLIKDGDEVMVIRTKDIKKLT